MESIAALSQWSEGQALYHERDPAISVYRVVTGAVRKCALLADGRRQILDFLLPGDLFGFGAHNAHRYLVEVIVDGTTIARYPRREIEKLAESDPEVGRAIRETAFESITRLQRRLVLLGQTHALERVSAFLLEMADRSSAQGGDATFLPMSRYDIADYLGVAVETVSRALTKLRCCGAVEFDGARLVHIRDRRALELGGEKAAWTEALGRQAAAQRAGNGARNLAMHGAS